MQPRLAQPQSTVAETREQAVPRKSAGEMADAASPAGQIARPAEPVARPVQPVARQADSAALRSGIAKKAAIAPTLAQRKEGESAKPATVAPVPIAEDVRVEARPVGGVAGGTVGGVVGGVAKGRTEVRAENVAAAAPVQAPSVAMRAAAAPKSELAMRDAAELVHSTSGEGPSGATATWRYGQGGLIERSSDGGRTWQRQNSGVTTSLADGSAATDLVCWLVGARGVVLRTTDGQTWERLPSPTSGDLVSVHAWSPSAASVTAADRSEYETADGGKTWRKRELGPALLP
jgi:hypothetical protein